MRQSNMTTLIWDKVNVTTSMRQIEYDPWDKVNMTPSIVWNKVDMTTCIKRSAFAH